MPVRILLGSIRTRLAWNAMPTSPPEITFIPLSSWGALLATVSRTGRMRAMSFSSRRRPWFAWSVIHRVTFLSPHFPYASGMCLRCHNPHLSANPRLLRAKVNELCLSCHLRTATSVPSQYLPTIALAADNRTGHPYERHPVSGSRDPLNGGEMSCISCHLAHGGTKLHLLKMGSEIPEDALNQNTETKDMCRKCHLLLWGLEGAGSAKKSKKKKTN